MDIAVLVFLIISTVLITFFSVVYIYERGWRSGLAEGKQYKPYEIITQGWQIKIPDCRGIIKLVDDSEEEDKNNG
jgi:hypothetical protein